MSVKYEFDSVLPLSRRKNYIFQEVSKRKLTDIYHSHDFFEIIMVDRGECTKLINGKNFEATHGTIIFLRPGDCHSFIGQSDDIHITCLSVREEEATRVASIYGEEAVKKLFFDKKSLTIMDSELNINLNSLIRKNAEMQEEDYILMFSFVIRQLLRNREDNIKAIPCELLSAMEKMKERENIRLGLPAFLRLSNYSHSQLGKLMHKHFGISPHEYIEEIKLGEAYRNLILTDLSAEEIAERVGYSSFSHFNKIFKKKYGITPATARKNYIKYTV